jgi:[ribosomal protein S18]-alanine N-acetyltransferase
MLLSLFASPDGPRTRGSSTSFGEQRRTKIPHAGTVLAWAVSLEIRQMLQAHAEEIATWRYPEPYSFYDADADAGDLALLLDPEARRGRYFAAFGDTAALVGFFEFKPEGDELEIGLGLRPDLTGRGLGLSFLEQGLAFARDRFEPVRFRLSVAAFNERAIRVYERAGFDRVRTFDHETAGAVHAFVEMTRPA